MEIPLQDVMLPLFVEQTHLQWCGWDDLDPPVRNVGVPTTMADFTAARETCRSWEEFLNETVEGAAHRLARRDFSLQVRPWCSTEELMKTSFDRNYELFANS